MHPFVVMTPDARTRLEEAEAKTDFEVVVNAHGPGMFRYAFWLCRDRSMAEDLVQETFLRAWRFRDGLNDRSYSAAAVWRFPRRWDCRDRR